MIDASVGIVVGTIVGGPVGADVGEAIGAVVGAKLGWIVGSLVGDIDGGDSGGQVPSRCAISVGEVVSPVTHACADVDHPHAPLQLAEHVSRTHTTSAEFATVPITSTLLALYGVA